MNAVTENNVEMCNAENSAESPPRRRRRSSFFERRSIVPETSMQMEIDYNKDEEDDVYLNQYYEQLLTEKHQWKKEVQNRRGLLHDAELQLKLAKKSDKLRINYGILSNEDIEFLRAKPNLTELVDSVKNLQKSTMETCALYKRLTELDDVILKDAEKKVERVTRLLLENSNSEVVESE